MSKPQTVILFEDDAANTLEPLTLTRAVWDLLCGLRTLGEKILAHFPEAHIVPQVRPYLSRLYPGTPLSKGGWGGSLRINGALIPGPRFIDVLRLPENTAWVLGGRVVAFRGSLPKEWQPGTQIPLEGFEKIEITSEFGWLYRYLWELVDAAGSEVAQEAGILRSLGQLRGSVHPTAVLVNEEAVYLAPGSKIGPLAVIDASNGPVVLDDDVEVGAQTVIEGPTYLGPHSKIKPLTHLTECCLGEETRVGGEVSHTIIQGFSNKQHGGFLGNSFIGHWCNLGSGTETSNLKNNYSPVKVQIGENLVDSGRFFVGLMMGDHSKSAIGSVFNTGTTVGVACNLIEPGFPPRFIPSFHWGGAQKLTPYPLHKTLEIARAVMGRRHRVLSETEEEVLRWVYDNRR